VSHSVCANGEPDEEHRNFCGVGSSGGCIGIGRAAVQCKQILRNQQLPFQCATTSCSVIAPEPEYCVLCDRCVVHILTVGASAGSASKRHCRSFGAWTS
jgi:hypothetical protein